MVSVQLLKTVNCRTAATFRAKTRETMAETVFILSKLQMGGDQADESCPALRSPSDGSFLLCDQAQLGAPGRPHDTGVDATNTRLERLHMFAAYGQSMVARTCLLFE